MKDHKRALIFLIGVLGFLAAPLSALAQSPAKQPAPPTLKTRPIPRTPDGKPDFTGFWA